MFDYTTKYLGLTLKNPLIISACSKTRDLDYCKKMQEFGASALVLPSLFEEEILMNQHELNSYFTESSHLSPESSDFLPTFQEFNNINGEAYLEYIQQMKKTVSIPVIASLNGFSVGGWVDYAAKIEAAGADALELNIYFIPTDFSKSSLQIEDEYIKIIEAVRKKIKIPLAVKVGPYFSSFANMASKIEKAGANGLVIFNRFLEPDFDLETLDVNPVLEFSHQQEMKLTLHWTALLYKNINMSICSGRGVKDRNGFIKLLMAGADVVSLSSALYQEGPTTISNILREAQVWFEENEYQSISQLKGSMSYRNVKDPSVFERANYMKILKRNY
jgi:dihydroorotate dehydrogenase (fumarate)